MPAACMNAPTSSASRSVVYAPSGLSDPPVPRRSGADRLSDDDVRTFLTLRDSEPLYFFASDLAYCGDSAAALRLLRESIPRDYCASSAIEIDPTFAAIRNSAGYGELLGAARACRTRFRDYVRAKTRTP